MLITLLYQTPQLCEGICVCCLPRLFLLYMSASVPVCVCVFVIERESERERDGVFLLIESGRAGFLCVSSFVHPKPARYKKRQNHRGMMASRQIGESIFFFLYYLLFISVFHFFFILQIMIK